MAPEPIENLTPPPPLARPHVLQSCWDMQLAGLGADALRAALEAKMFVQLDDYVSTQQLAERLSLLPANAGYFLELLWSLDVLERKYTANGEATYRTRTELQPYLHAGSPRYCGDALLYRHRVLRQAGMQLPDQLCERTPPLPAPVAQQQGWAEAARVQIAQEQQAITVEVACAVLGQQPEFATARRMLDLGGGPGLVAIALAKLQPELSGAVFEYPAVAAVAQQNIEHAALSGRLTACGGDLAQDDFGSGYDLIWCSSVLHFVPDVPATLNRLYTALRPGGLLVCCHAEIADAARQARPVLQYYLHMRMQGRHVWHAGQLATQLQRVGFDRVEQLDDVRFPVAPVAVLLARKGKDRP
ncbi:MULTISPECIES: class I SAM-dependent methyltransferase [unclassified Pseudomonas]|uniref:class I SAM-dependent methyltransferase n=1 Tax=unclassified Pseudomonas TaxID=196821 RepID=UPI000D6EF328|nr:MULTISPECIES: class I SAM-dependent methyltransferase [unclassified Pseudomonas]MED5608059.1 class I SAM-dependent methyltransferase [Pseudomonas sp. JH-2]PWU28922.1 O-methyltransferase [Pseudomonas sp. RW407]